MKATALLLSLALSASAYAGDGVAPAPSDYGTRADAGAPGRHIVVKPGARGIHVHDGETVHFEVNGKQFDWNFNTRTREAVLDLSTIAPDDVQVEGVRIFVMRDPTYFPG
ncbi:CzcE family metal-binding protein [Massilia niastensis]|uniref:CzcE family metal-binding protein n=1 Tax=Massilia niastensis TaxID=544911 RepID=UPI00146A7C3E|nr:CzcE family metal-binding protein [Massilia niastensis]